MKMQVLTALLFAAMTLPAVAQAHDPKQHTAAAKIAAVDEAAQPAIAVVEQFSKALQVADFKRVGELLAPDVLILESGGAERSRDEYLGHHAISDAAFLKAAHIQVKQRTARVEGNLAWIGTESELHATKDGKPLTLLSTETMILRKAGSDWRIVHIHWSSRPKKSNAFSSGAAGSAQPSAQAVAPKWMAADDRIVLEKAQGAGMAKAAEANGWPGPKHVLDLAEELQLDAMQRERMQALMASMQTSAYDLGARVIAAEGALDAALAQSMPQEQRIAALSEEVGTLRGQLRATHLTTHLQAAALLTPDQRHRYGQLRGLHQHAE